jgi:hypothetical protein
MPFRPRSRNREDATSTTRWRLSLACSCETLGTLFRERGLNGIGVVDIMAAAGLTHGGFYGQFANKDAAGHFRQARARYRSPGPRRGSLSQVSGRAQGRDSSR